jgi:hypothetical protein
MVIHLNQMSSVPMNSMQMNPNQVLASLLSMNSPQLQGQDRPNPQVQQLMGLLSQMGQLGNQVGNNQMPLQGLALQQLQGLQIPNLQQQLLGQNQMMPNQDMGLGRDGNQMSSTIPQNASGQAQLQALASLLLNKQQ